VENFLRESLKAIADNKLAVTNFLNKQAPLQSLPAKEIAKKQRELRDFAKFVVVLSEQIEMISISSEEPDFVINWKDEIFGVEHTEVINEAKKRQHEKNDWFVRLIQHHFIKSYGNIHRHITISLKKDIIQITEKEKNKLLKQLSTEYTDLDMCEEELFQLSYPGYITIQNRENKAKEIAQKIYRAFKEGRTYFDDHLLNYATFYPSQTCSIHRNFGWSAGSLSDKILESIKKKEKKIDAYLKNTNNAKQFLFLVIQGWNSYSDYSFIESDLLKNVETKFDKVIVFNFFTADIFILK